MTMTITEMVALTIVHGGHGDMSIDQPEGGSMTYKFYNSEYLT